MRYSMIIGTLLAQATGCTALLIATIGAAHAEITFSDAPI